MLQDAQAILSTTFALATVATTLNANGLPLLQPDQLDLSLQSVLPALPGTALLLLLLGECAHQSYSLHPSENTYLAARTGLTYFRRPGAYILEVSQMHLQSPGFTCGSEVYSR